MQSEVEFTESLNKLMKELTKKVAKVEIEQIDYGSVEDKNSSSLATTTSGEYKLTFALHMDNRTMEVMSVMMRHGKPVSEEEIEICMKEYFNILCGGIVSMINKKAAKIARFSVPVIEKGFSFDVFAEPVVVLNQLYYKCGSGILILKIFLKKEKLQEE